MIRALKSSFFRFYKTGALYLTVAGSVAFAFLVALYVYGSYFSIYAFKRPRFLDNSFVLMCLNALLYVMPFAIAVFCVLFTGTDLEYRSVNNKITTGISRVQIYCADLTVSLLASVISCAIQEGLIFLIVKIWAVKSTIRFDTYLIGMMITVIIICISFTALYVFFQYFARNKLLALVITLMIIPCVMIVSTLISSDLKEPYRTQVYVDDTDKTEWKLNPAYVSGTKREIYTFIIEASPYSDDEDFYLNTKKNLQKQSAAAAIVFVLSTAAGFLAISKKEFP